MPEVDGDIITRIKMPWIVLEKERHRNSPDP